MRFLNIQENQTFRFFVDKKKGGMPIFADSVYFDDPVGTIKTWTGSIVGSYIPPGWRLCDGTGGTIDLRGRFIMGINTDTGAPGNENSIGDTGGHRYHGYTENQHQKMTAYTAGYDNIVLGQH